ncbi:unnamed protein product, partial [Discosporangium mesarthrocarpum]
MSARGNRTRDGQGIRLPHGICLVRALVLIDLSPLLVTKHGDWVTAATIFLDALRLSVLRILVQLHLHCPKESWVEWSYRFFDSRRDGVGKTPRQLKARLRSRLRANGASRRTRGFTRLDKSSFHAFSEACLAIICAVQDDPLLRDQAAVFRRWAHGRRQPHQGGRKHRSGGDLGGGDRGTGEDSIPKMFDGHDVSSHDVVVRSLLEVIEEFGEADFARGMVSTSPATLKLQEPGQEQQQRVLLLHTPCPRTELEVERFALVGNYTQEASLISDI